jgi:pre-rRNA-processing protein TSR3
LAKIQDLAEHSETRETPKLFTVELREDDPAKCTSAKMRKFNLAKQTKLAAIREQSIVLNPFASIVILKTDSSIYTLGGLVVIDCSWVNAGTVFDRRLKGQQRRLPALMAGNPTNYSKLNSLSSLEAAAASLYIMDYKKISTRLLSLYKWGGTFLSLNENALIDYSAASSQEEINRIELEYFPRNITY